MVLRRLPIVISVALIAAICGDVRAEFQEAKLSGIVRDATGAAVPGATVIITNPTTKVSKTATTAADGTYSVTLAPGSYNVSVELPGFRSETQRVDIVAGGSSQVEFSLQNVLSEEVTVTAMKRESTVLNTPFSVAAPTEEVLRARGVEDIEGVAANVSGFTVQNLGPGQSQVAIRGVSAGQIVRDQPGVKEQVGAYLDESVISMSLFTPDIDLFDTKSVTSLEC